MHLTRHVSVLAFFLLALVALGGCAGEIEHDKSYIVVGERVYKGVTLEHMFTMAQRTMRDMRLTRSTISKNDVDAFLVFFVPETEFGEMAMDIKPTNTNDVKVTMFSHDRQDQDPATHILDDLAEQLALDKDPMHAKKH